MLNGIEELEQFDREATNEALKPGESQLRDMVRMMRGVRRAGQAKVGGLNPMRADALSFDAPQLPVGLDAFLPAGMDATALRKTA